MIQQLEIRNTPGGAIWQVYHVDTDRPYEYELLSKVARGNGFMDISLSTALTEEETWPGWRDTKEWKAFLEKEGVTANG